jgi:hypothetical protein
VRPIQNRYGSTLSRFIPRAHEQFETTQQIAPANAGSPSRCERTPSARRGCARSFGVSMRFKPVMVVPVGLSVTVIALAFLYLHIEGVVRNRLEYQSWIPCFIGVVLALAVGLWPVSRIRSLRSRLIVRTLVFTLCLAPIPYGPEGTLVPALLAMIFPPLIMIFLFPIAPLLTFLAVLGMVASYESIASAARRIAEPVSRANGHPPTL